MELKQIQYFIALFEEGTVTRAARRLNIAQPALSMQIAKLETEIRQKLFERGPHGMAPTEAARLMYRLYTPIMRDIDHAREHLSRRDVIVTGRVSLGMVSSEAQSVLPESLARFDALFPQVEVSVADGFSAQLIDAVESGRLDAAIINKPRGRLTLHVVHVKRIAALGSLLCGLGIVALGLLVHSTSMPLLQAGVDTTVVALRLGHAGVRSTDAYVHAT